VKVLTTQEIFLSLISVSAVGNIQPVTNSSDTFGNQTCAAPHSTSPPRALKHNVSYVDLEKFLKHFTFVINVFSKSITVDNEYIKFEIKHSVNCNASVITHPQTRLLHYYRKRLDTVLQKQNVSQGERKIQFTRKGERSEFLSGGGGGGYKVLEWLNGPQFL
jgi:hypothetical protein